MSGGHAVLGAEGDGASSGLGGYSEASAALDERREFQQELAQAKKSTSTALPAAPVAKAPEKAPEDKKAADAKAAAAPAEESAFDLPMLLVANVAQSFSLFIDNIFGKNGAIGSINGPLSFVKALFLIVAAVVQFAVINPKKGEAPGIVSSIFRTIFGGLPKEYDDKGKIKTQKVDGKDVNVTAAGLLGALFSSKDKSKDKAADKPADKTVSADKKDAGAVKADPAKAATPAVAQAASSKPTASASASTSASSVAGAPAPSFVASEQARSAAASTSVAAAPAA